jgi:hypothetical protein
VSSKNLHPRWRRTNCSTCSTDEGDRRKQRSSWEPEVSAAAAIRRYTRGGHSAGRRDRTPVMMSAPGAWAGLPSVADRDDDLAAGVADGEGGESLGGLLEDEHVADVDLEAS